MTINRKSSQTVLAAGGVILLALVLFFYFREDDQARIRKNFHAIRTAAEKTPEEGNIAMAAKHQTILNHLDEQVEIFLVDPPIQQTFSAEELTRHAFALRRLCQSISLTATGIDITFPEQDKAVLTCYGTAKITSTMAKSLEKSRPAAFTFVKKNDQWLLAAAKEKNVFK